METQVFINNQANGSGMKTGQITKYRPFSPIDLPNRQWPSRTITKAPIWCSVDLRDGNQALAIPMSVDEKVRMFQTLVDIGFKEIEVGFPAASQIEFDFLRRLVDENLIPDDIKVQVLVQARRELIDRTFEALEGVKNAIFHLYNSTSPVQRRIVFGLSKSEIIDIAVKGVERIKELRSTLPKTRMTLEYSPESFSATEIAFALEICEAVVDVWQPTTEDKIILNLPVTVEVATANVHADQIEWFCDHLRNRETAIISLHTHNDRGTGVACSELGLMAGADRVEGTLFGNGERTGNVDIITLALNMYTQGLDPKLDISDINAIRHEYERCTRMRVPQRHPYAGELVFTAFSGSHQDAINKGMKAQAESEEDLWDVPYLPIDPQDIGRNYKAIIRINAQSGKGGVAYVLENEYGYQLPKAMHIEFGKIINQIADLRGDELTAEQIQRAFEATYLEATKPLVLDSFRARINDDVTGGAEGEPSRFVVNCSATVGVDGKSLELQGLGNGPINAFVHALTQEVIPPFEILSYAEHSLSRGAEAQAIAYIQIQTASGKTFFGAAIDTNIELASIKGVVSAVNRAMQTEKQLPRP